MRKFLVLLLLLPFAVKAQSYDGKRYRFLHLGKDIETPAGFTTLSDGTVLLVWTKNHGTENDSDLICARTILKSGASGPVMQLLAVPGNHHIHLSRPVALKSKTFGFVFTDATGEGQILFSSFSATGEKIVDRAVIATKANNADFPSLATDESGAPAACWTENYHGKNTIRFATFGQDGKLRGTPAFMDTTYVDQAERALIAFHSGRIVISTACLIRTEKVIAFRIFSFDHQPLSEVIMPYKIRPHKDLHPGALTFVSSSTFALGWEMSYADSVGNTSTDIVVQTFRTDGTEIRYSALKGYRCLPYMELSPTKNSLVLSFAATDDSLRPVVLSSTLSLKDYQFSSVTTLETLLPHEQFLVMQSGVAGKYPFFSFNTCVDTQSNRTLSYAYFKKAKKQKHKKVKKQKQKPEEKTDPKDVPENLRGR